MNSELKLQKQYDDEARRHDELAAENKKLSDELREQQTSYYSTKLGTDSKLVPSIDEELQTSNLISKRHALHSDGFQKDFTKIVQEMDEVLGTYERDKKAERELVVQSYQKFKDISEVCSWRKDVILEKTKRVDDDIAQIGTEIEEIRNRIDEMRDTYIAESASGQDSSLSSVISDLKMTNMRLELPDVK